MLNTNDVSLLKNAFFCENNTDLYTMKNIFYVQPEEAKKHYIDSATTQICAGRFFYGKAKMRI